MARKAKSTLLPEPDPTSTIGFRLDASAREVLEQRAKIFGLSPHALARQYVIESLAANDERQALHRAIAALQALVSELRSELAHALQVLLVSAGKVTPEQSEKYVKENFNRN